MSIKVDAGALASAMKGAAYIVDAKSTHFMLSRALLIAESDTLTIITTNLDTEYRQTIPAAVDHPFSCCVDAKRLAEMASVASAQLSMALDGNILTIKSGRSRWAAPSLPADDFPLMPEQGMPKPVKMPAKELASIIRRTAPFVSDNMARSNLQGVFINKEGPNVRFVATDSYRLASLEVNRKWPAGAEEMIAPVELLSAIERVCDDGDCTVAWDGKKLRFTQGEITITGKAIEGEYPQYRRIIPEPKGPYAVDSDAFVSAIKRVRIASERKERKLQISRGENVLRIKVAGDSGFEGEDEIPAECDEGFEFSINADFLSAMLEAVGTETAEVYQEKPTTPIRIDQVSGPKGEKFIGVVMPIGG